MKLFLQCILALLIVSACSTQKLDLPVNYVSVAGRIRAETAKEIQDQFDVELIGFGGGMMSIVRVMSLSFNIYKPMGVEEARRLAVNCEEIFLKNINSNKEIRPFLIEFPYPASRAELSFFVVTKDRPQKADSLTSFSIDNGEISYDNNQTQPPLYKSFHKESYEEARRIVLKENKAPEHTNGPLRRIVWPALRTSLSKVFSIFTLWIPDSPGHEKYTGSPEGREMKWDLDGYASKLAQTYGMKFHRVGDITPDQDSDYFISFQDKHRITLEEGRIFAATFAENFLHKLRTDPIVKKYHEMTQNRRKKMRYPPFLSDEIVPRQMGFQIGYWDDNVERPQKPYLAQILFVGGIFYFYEADPQTQALQLVYEESYDNALAYRNNAQKDAPQTTDHLQEKSLER